MTTDEQRISSSSSDWGRICCTIPSEHDLSVVEQRGVSSIYHLCNGKRWNSSDGVFPTEAASLAGTFREVRLLANSSFGR